MFDRQDKGNQIALKCQESPLLGSRSQLEAPLSRVGDFLVPYSADVMVAMAQPVL